MLKRLDVPSGPIFIPGQKVLCIKEDSKIVVGSIYIVKSLGPIMGGERTITLENNALYFNYYFIHAVDFNLNKIDIAWFFKLFASRIKNG